MNLELTYCLLYTFFLYSIQVISAILFNKIWNCSEDDNIEQTNHDTSHHLWVLLPLLSHSPSLPFACFVLLENTWKMPHVNFHNFMHKIFLLGDNMNSLLISFANLDNRERQWSMKMEMIFHISCELKYLHFPAQMCPELPTSSDTVFLLMNAVQIYIANSVFSSYVTWLLVNFSLANVDWASR